MKKNQIALILTGLAAVLLLSGCVNPVSAPAPAQSAAVTQNPAAGQTPAGEQAQDPVPTEDPMADLPDAETFRTAFFAAVNSFHPGTAGSSLGRAAAACRVLEFADSWNLDRVDGAYAEMIAGTLKTAWNGLDESDQGFFAENWPSLTELIGDTFTDFDSRKGLYEDAGVLGTMQKLMENADHARSCWEALAVFVSNELAAG